MVGDGPQNGPAIRAIRRAAQRTQEDVAAAAGIDQTYLSLLESEKRPAPAHVIDSLAVALQVPVAAIVRTTLAKAGAA